MSENASERIAAIFEELGPMMPDAEYIAKWDDDRWSVGFAGEQEIGIVYDAGRNWLTFSANVGFVRSENQQEVYVAALQYNSLWRQTGGVRLGLDGDDELELLAEIPANDLRTPDLKAIIENFVAKVAAWRIAINAEQPTKSVPVGDTGLRI